MPVILPTVRSEPLVIFTLPSPASATSAIITSVSRIVISESVVLAWRVPIVVSRSMPFGAVKVSKFAVTLFTPAPLASVIAPVVVK